MGAPVFLLQIVEAGGDHPVAILPGGGPLEVDLIDSCVKGIMGADVIEKCVQRILAKGVRFRTQDHIEQDVREGITEVLEHEVRAGVKGAITGLKKQTRYLVT